MQFVTTVFVGDKSELMTRKIEEFVHNISFVDGLKVPVCTIKTFEGFKLAKSIYAHRCEIGCAKQKRNIIFHWDQFDFRCLPAEHMNDLSAMIRQSRFVKLDHVVSVRQIKDLTADVWENRDASYHQKSNWSVPISYEMWKPVKEVGHFSVNNKSPAVACTV